MGFFRQANDDADWWKVTVTEDGALSGTLTIDFEQGTSSDYDIYVSIWASDGTTQIVYSSARHPDTPAQASADIQPGVYYFRVGLGFYSWQKEPESGYILTVDFQPE